MQKFPFKKNADLADYHFDLAARQIPKSSPSQKCAKKKKFFTDVKEGTGRNGSICADCGSIPLMLLQDPRHGQSPPALRPHPYLGLGPE